MFTSSPFILPYEPGYTGHWEAEKRRKETKEWLRQREREIELRRRREREIDSPPVAPDTSERVEKRRPDFGRHFVWEFADRNKS